MSNHIYRVGSRLREATFSAHKIRPSTALLRRERTKLSMPAIEHEPWRPPCTSVSARINGWPSLPALSARRSFPDQCIMFQNTQKMIPQHGQTVRRRWGQVSCGWRKKCMALSRFVLNGREWRLRSVQTCQSSRSQKAGMTFCLLVGVIGPLFTHCRKSSDTIHVAGDGDYKLQYDCREEQIWFMFYR